MAERPIVSRPDGALLFLSRARSDPEGGDPTQPHQSAKPRRSARIASIKPITDDLPRSQVRLEDVIACLQLKLKNEVSDIAISHGRGLMDMFCAQISSREDVSHFAEDVDHF
jgi:hypothetical protein